MNQLELMTDLIGFMILLLVLALIAQQGNSPWSGPEAR